MLRPSMIAIIASLAASAAEAQSTRAQVNTTVADQMTDRGADSINNFTLSALFNLITSSVEFLADKPKNYNVEVLGANQGSQTLTNQAFQTAFTNAAANNGSVEIPCSAYTLTANIAATLQAKGSLAIKAGGHECVTLNFVGSNGITITEIDQFSSLLAHDFTMTTTDTTGAYTALTVQNPNAVVYNASTGFGQNIIRDVFYRGSDAYTTGQAYWGHGFVDSNVSYVNLQDGGFWGALQSGVYKGVAASAAGLSSPASYAVVVGFHHFQVQDCGTGFYNGDWLQGVFIDSGSNFTNCVKGVDEPTSFTGSTSQLVIADSQFYTTSIGINAPLIVGLSVHDTTIIVGSGTGLVVGADGHAIHHNFFQNDTGTAQFKAINITNANAIGGEIDANIFKTFGTGIEDSVASGISIENIHDNTFYATTTKYVIDNAISGVTISDPTPSLAAVIGASGGMPACSTRYAGTEFPIIDQSSTTFLATIAGGGSNWVKARCNGTNYQAH